MNILGLILFIFNFMRNHISPRYDEEYFQAIQTMDDEYSFWPSVRDYVDEQAAKFLLLYKIDLPEVEYNEVEEGYGLAYKLTYQVIWSKSGKCLMMDFDGIGNISYSAIGEKTSIKGEATMANDLMWLFLWLTS